MVSSGLNMVSRTHLCATQFQIFGHVHALKSHLFYIGFRFHFFVSVDMKIF